MHDFSTGRSGYDRVLAAVAATFLLTGTVTFAHADPAKPADASISAAVPTPDTSNVPPPTAADVKPDTYLVGVAEVDITPKDPVRMNGFGARRDEFTRVNHPIYARAISIRHADDQEPLVLMTVDVLGITAAHRAELVKRLKGKVSPERLRAVYESAHPRAHAR